MRRSYQGTFSGTLPLRTELYRSGNTSYIKNSKYSLMIAGMNDAESTPSSFQQALYKSVAEKNAQLEKRLENVIREGAFSPHRSMVSR